MRTTEPAFSTAPLAREESREGRWAQRVGAVGGFCLLTALAAQVRVPVPWTDVPMTLQPLAVLLAGLMLAPGSAVAAMALYVGAGAAGLPVFVPGSAGVSGPTGGYLVGFVAAAWLVSVLRGRGEVGLMRMSSVSLAGMLCILGLGVAWRAWLFGGNWGLAAQSGFVPFAVKAIVEALLAAVVAGRLRRVTGLVRSLGS